MCSYECVEWYSTVAIYRHGYQSFENIHFDFMLSYEMGT